MGAGQAKGEYTTQTPDNHQIELDDKKTIKEILGHNGEPMRNVVRTKATPDERYFNVERDLDNLQDDIENGQERSSKKKTKKRTKDSDAASYQLPLDEDEDDVERQIRNVENRMRDDPDKSDDEEAQRIKS